MSKIVKRFAPVVIFIVMVGFFWKALHVDHQKLPSALVGKTVPAFQLTSLQQEQIFLTPDIFKGKVTLLNAFATWCGYCQMEHPVLLDIARSEKGLQLIGIDYKDQRQSAIEWLNARGNPYSFVINDEKGSLGIDLGVYGVPETFLIDRQGVIRERWAGPITRATWDAELKPVVEALLREPS